MDSHAHLDAAAFDSDRGAVLARAQAAGVERILTIVNGTRVEEFQRSLALGEGVPGIWVALGVHPHEARQATPALLAALKSLAQEPQVLAWGEISLDYHYNRSRHAIQQGVFREQLRLARELGLPVIIHCREAWDDCLEILEQEWAPAGLGGILHCFSGTANEAARARAWKFLISFAGNLTFPRAENLCDIARATPLDYLLTETDCPYLAPQAHRGQRNEPAFVLEVAAGLGRLKGLPTEAIGEVTTENFLRLFPRART